MQTQNSDQNLTYSQSSLMAQTRNPNLSAPKVDRTLPNEVLKKFGSSWWTGLAPEKCAGFNKDQNYLQALPLLNLKLCTRQDVLDYFNNSWTLTELLFSSIKNEETYTRSPYHQLRHPKIFYYGHPAVLFLNKLRLAGVVEKPVDLYLEKVLETGVDEMSWDDMSKNEMEWPSVATVKDYRKKVYEIVTQIIKTHPDLDLEYRQKNNIELNMDHPLWALFMGMEHEKIHFETSSVLIRELPIELVETPNFWAPLASSKTSVTNFVNGKIAISDQFVKPKLNEHFFENSWVQFKGEKFTYGKNKAYPTFGWDNEYGLRQNETKDFQLTSQLISNGEYYEFVSSGAYQNDKYWQPEGLMWRKFRNCKRPTFWVAYGPEGLHDYKLRTLFEIIDMPWDWPVEVNYHEAQAYCQWKQEQDQAKKVNSQLKYRLITEAEFVTVKNKLGVDPVLQTSSFNDAKNFSYANNFNFNFVHSSATSVRASQAVHGLYDLMGNVWQWAEDQFNPLEGFKIHPIYDDFSTPCFDGKHQMILGGSFISCGHEASTQARFHFRPHFYQHSGFRMAATLDGSSDNNAIRLKKSAGYVHVKRENVLDQMQKENWWMHVDQPLEVQAEDLKKYYDLTSDFVQNFEKKLAQTSPKGQALNPRTNDTFSDYKWSYQPTKNFPENPEKIEKLFQFLEEEVKPLGQQPGHPGYMAYVAGAANSLSAPAQALALTMNQFTAHHNLSPGLVNLEVEVVKWFINLMKFPETSAGGVLTSGGSQANMMAMVAARQQKLKTPDLSKARFYASKHVHHCIGKALAFLGFPKETLVFVDVDHELRMNIEDLKAKIAADQKLGLTAVAVIGTAGSTNTGTVDPLEKIGDVARAHNIWFHVDGAYGALFMLTQQGQKTLKGLESADSLAFDPHKALQIPYGVGGLLVKDKKHLAIHFAGESTYMPPSAGVTDKEMNVIDFADITPELSRDPRGLRLWLPLKAYGIAPFKLNLEEKIKLIDYTASELKKLGSVSEVTKPDLTILTFRLESNEKTQKLMAWVNQQEKVFLSGTWVEQKFMIRVCLLGYRLHFKDIQTMITQIKEGLTHV